VIRAGNLECEGDVLGRREPLEKPEILEDEANPSPELGDLSPPDPGRGET
jgi:hypothetical protein